MKFKMNRRLRNNVIASIIMLFAVYGIITTAFDFSKYLAYVTSEIKFINKHGTSYTFKNYEDMPKTEGPAFFIKPPVDKNGKYEIFIADDVHKTNMSFLTMYSFCEVTYVIAVIGCSYTLVKTNYKRKDKVTGKVVENE
ncbi:hypothetical protein UT300012_24650 [Paraclostridium bifermentans]